MKIYTEVTTSEYYIGGSLDVRQRRAIEKGLVELNSQRHDAGEFNPVQHVSKLK